MSAVVAGTKAKLQDLLPGRIGSNKAFTDSYVEDLIMAGFYDVVEKCDLLTVTDDITLANDTLWYDLDSSLIDISFVEFKSDGTNVDGHLTAATLSDLDRMSPNWRDDRGTRPEYYSLLSAPGVYSGSQILVYRPPSSVTAEIITVTGIGIGTTTTRVPDDVQRLCLVPYVLAHLKATEPELAIKYYKMYQDGMDRVRGRFSHPYSERISRGGG